MGSHEVGGTAVRRRRALRTLRTAVACAVVLGVAGCRSDDPPSGTAPTSSPVRGRAEAQAFLDAWSARDDTLLAAMTTDPAGPAAKELADITAGLHLSSASFTVREVVGVDDAAPFAMPSLPPGGAGAVAPGTIPEGDRLVATFDARLEVGGLGEWTYEGRLPLVVTTAGPRVVWAPSDVFPGLAQGQRLDRQRTKPDRAPILAADGTELVGMRPAVAIGIKPEAVEDLDSLAQTLADTLGLDADRIKADVTAPGVKPDWFIPVATWSDEAYQRVRGVVRELPGTVFKTNDSRVPPDPTFGRHVLGRTGEVTAELLEKLGPLYQQGDTVGFTGLEGAYEEQLAGTPSGTIRIIDAAGKPVSTVKAIAGADPVPLVTTLETQAQFAAERSLEGIATPAALVAVDVKGNIVAAASRPLDEDFNRAFLGAYAPGSTFKIVTADALFENGRTPESPTSCPATIEVGGRTFHNFEGEQAGSLTIGQAFATSCNTAFVGASRELPDGAVADAAGRFGFGTDYDVGLVSKGGTYPAPVDATEAAAQAIGQGRVVASPLHMATVGSAVLSGQWQPPHLVLTTARQTEGTASPPPPANAAVSASAKASLLDVMRRVVTGGTGGTGVKADVAGREVRGKTGTAEFGPAPEGGTPRTHAWFVGLSGDVSVAVIVEGGGVGGDVAAPLVAKFFTPTR